MPFQGKDATAFGITLDSRPFIQGVEVSSEILAFLSQDHIGAGLHVTGLPPRPMQPCPAFRSGPLRSEFRSLRYRVRPERISSATRMTAVPIAFRDR